MRRSALLELGESVGDVVSTGVSTIGDLASTAASRTGDLASSAIDHASTAFDKVGEQVGEVSSRVGDAARDRFAPPPKRSRTPWALLLLAAAVGAGLFWKMRQDRTGSVLSDRPPTVGSGGQSEPANPAAY